MVGMLDILFGINIWKGNSYFQDWLLMHKLLCLRNRAHRALPSSKRLNKKVALGFLRVTKERKLEIFICCVNNHSPAIFIPSNAVVLRGFAASSARFAAKSDRHIFLS